MDNYVGKRLDGRYEIREIVGVGGMAVVYKAYDNIDDRMVSIKVLKDEFLANENSADGSKTNPKPLPSCPIRTSSRSTMSLWAINSSTSSWSTWKASR